MQCMHRSKESALRTWPCAPPSTQHQLESQLQLESVHSQRRFRRKRLPAYSPELVQMSLEVAQTKHTSQHEQANKRIITHIQRWTCKPWTESCCQSLNLPGYSLLAPPTLAQPVSCLNASPTPSSCSPPMTTPLWSILFDMVALQECSSAPPQVSAVLISVMLNLVLSPQA